MKIDFTSRTTGEGYGFVYVMSYPGSDKVKIGHALNPTTRAKDIGGTLAPETPVVEAYFWCSERREAVERAAHTLQASRRANGEWFHLSVGDALATVRRAARQVSVQVELVYDRNEWEAKAAADAAAKEAEKRATQERVNAEWNAALDAKRAAAAARAALAVDAEFQDRPEPRISSTTFDSMEAFAKAQKKEPFWTRLNRAVFGHDKSATDRFTRFERDGVNY